MKEKSSLLYFLWPLLSLYSFLYEHNFPALNVGDVTMLLTPPSKGTRFPLQSCTKLNYLRGILSLEPMFATVRIFFCWICFPFFPSFA